MVRPKNPQHATFAEEYIIDFNGAGAAVRAGYSPKTAKQQAARMLARDDVAAYVASLQEKRAERTAITADRVLEELALVAFADHAELSQYRVGACRHCHGKDHAYQYRDKDEFQTQLREWQAAKDMAKPQSDPENNIDLDTRPTATGGYGYTRNLAPAPDCPKCDGLGEPFIVFADTSRLSPRGKALFAGVKQTQNGIELKTLDKVRALEMIGRHHGLFKGTAERAMDGIAGLLAEIAQNGSRAPLGSTAEMPPEVIAAMADDPSIGGMRPDDLPKAAPSAPPTPKAKRPPRRKAPPPPAPADEIDPETGEVLP